MRMNTLNGVWSGGTPEGEGTGRLSSGQRSEKSCTDDEETFNDALRFPPDEVDRGGNANSSPLRHPKPPSLMKTSKNSSMEANVKRRRIKPLKTSQESMTERTGTGSSSDSLQDDVLGPPAFDGSAQSPSRQCSIDGSLTDTPVSVCPPRDCGGSLSELDKKNFKSCEPILNSAASSKIRLSPIHPSGPMPAVELCTASTSLRTANRIDRDCVDYGDARRAGLERLHRNLSDSRLLETMVSDNTSLNSMKSTSSVLNPIRPRDVRNR